MTEPRVATVPCDSRTRIVAAEGSEVGESSTLGLGFGTALFTVDPFGSGSSVITPGGTPRNLPVPVDGRTATVLFEQRTVTVAVDNRTRGAGQCFSP